MPYFETSDAKIYYETHGTGFPLLLIAPGGMKSAISFWENTPWNPIEQLQDKYCVVAMDQRNAGNSSGQVAADHGWHTYTQDQLGLMDHLGLSQFHVAGMCIGGPYALGLIQAAPERVTSATLFQTIGRDNNAAAFYAMFDDWAEVLMPQMPDVEADAWSSFRENMYGGDTVLFNVDREFVAQTQTPLLVLMGNDLYHPESASRMIAATAPDVEFVESWKEGPAKAQAQDTFTQFLAQNTPE
ncbi:MAG: alpha/beta hydrolase [Pseudomonadaceae bacterium]|nr:alpha/beta hydrolase [Pseudomonadaceae bacterium]